MKPTRILLAAFPLTMGCPGEFEYDEDATICGMVEIVESSYYDDCDLPATVRIATVTDGERVCKSDTGSFRDWVDVVVDEPVVDDGGHFQSTVDPGAYGVYVIEDAPGGDCYDCEGVTATADGCAEVTLQVRFVVPVDAPNLYLYPTEPSMVKVRLPRVERITASDPVYTEQGWEVLAMPDGELITEEGPRDYLFYEIDLPADDFQRKEGWCVEGHLAQASIETAMEELGFLPNEIDDFAEFWDAQFPTAETITVYPQIEQVSWLRVRPAPEHLLRAWFILDSGCHPVDPPLLEPVERSGYHAAEWGLAVLPPLQGAEPFVRVW